MDINIGESILEFLQNNDGAYIPDLGVFRMIELPSNFTLKDDILTPPTKRLTFSQSKATDGFSIFLADKYKISPSTANLVLSKFAQKANNGILNFGSCIINGLGEIQKNEKGYTFSPVVSNFHKSYLFLNPITLKPVSPTERTVAQTKSPIQKAPSEKVASKIETTAPIATAATVTPKTVSPKPEREIPLSETKTESEKKSLKQSLNEAYKEQITKNETSNGQTAFPIYEEPEKSFLSKIMWPLLALLFIVLSVFGCMRYCGDGSNLKDSLSSSGNVVGEKLKDGKEAISDNLSTNGVSEAVLQSPNYLKYKDILQPENLSTGCAVIVGSFTKTTNVVKMKDRIVRAGLEPITDDYGRFTRVGIRFECLEHDLKGYLDTIRTTFDRKSWYLTPSFKVPYN